MQKHVLMKIEEALGNIDLITVACLNQPIEYNSEKSLMKLS